MSKVSPRIQRMDKTQADIVKALRFSGYSVLDIHGIGRGAPDIVVADERETVLVEVKRLGESYTVDELKFAASWTGPIITAITEHDVIAWFEMRKNARKCQS